MQHATSVKWRNAEHRPGEHEKYEMLLKGTVDGMKKTEQNAKKEALSLQSNVVLSVLLNFVTTG